MSASDGSTLRLLNLARDNIDVMQTASERIASMDASLRTLSDVDRAEECEVLLDDELNVAISAARRQTSGSRFFDVSFGAEGDRVRANVGLAAAQVGVAMIRFGSVFSAAPVS